MKLEIYYDILSSARENLSSHLQGINDICIKYPQFSRSTIISILNQDTQRKVKKTLYHHSKKANEYYTSYKNDTNKGNDIIIKMAQKLDLPPCLLARIILEQYLNFSPDQATVSKKDVSRLMKEPHLIDDNVLSSNITLCLYADKFYGPVSDTIKRSSGHEFEVLLKNKLHSHNIPFHDENYLRSRGYDKTPDVVLQLPIAVDHRVINWIESKALFADHVCHQGYLTDQYSTYINRFGPGLVIYWLGYTDGLENLQNKHLAIIDHFPDDFVALEVVLR